MVKRSVGREGGKIVIRGRPGINMRRRRINPRRRRINTRRRINMRGGVLT